MYFVKPLQTSCKNLDNHLFNNKNLVVRFIQNFKEVNFFFCLFEFGRNHNSIFWSENKMTFSKFCGLIIKLKFGIYLDFYLELFFLVFYFAKIF